MLGDEFDMNSGVPSGPFASRGDNPGVAPLGCWRCTSFRILAPLDSGFYPLSHGRPPRGLCRGERNCKSCDRCPGRSPPGSMQIEHHEAIRRRECGCGILNPVSAQYPGTVARSCFPPDPTARLTVCLPYDGRHFQQRRGGRVVEGTRLESGRTRKGTASSNLALSAIQNSKPKLYLMRHISTVTLF